MRARIHELCDVGCAQNTSKEAHGPLALLRNVWQQIPRHAKILFFSNPQQFVYAGTLHFSQRGQCEPPHMSTVLDDLDCFVTLHEEYNTSFTSHQ